MKQIVIFIFYIMASQNVLAFPPLSAVQNKVALSDDIQAEEDVEVKAQDLEGADKNEGVVITDVSSQVIPTQELLGFQGWKARQVSLAKDKLENLKKPVDIATPKTEKNSEQSSPQELSPMEAHKKKEEMDAHVERLRQLEFNLEIAQSLTIHDYFSLYLKTKSREEINTVVKKLSPEELTELLVSYRDRIDGPIPSQTKTDKPVQKNL